MSAPSSAAADAARPDTIPFEPSGDLARTPLHALHLRLGAKMTAFAGYDMPVQYPAGLMTEHLHTRAAAGLFDVSHMGQIALASPTGGTDEVAVWLETLIPVDVIGLKAGRQRYGLLTDDAGGVRDDLMIARFEDRFVLVVNAGCKIADEAHLRAHLPETIEMTVLDRGLIALQGPGAEAALANLATGVAAMRFMDVAEIDVLGAPCLISRSGYTGEDGFEISVPPDRAEAIAQALLDDPSVLPVGLGARDSLRLEAGLCLHGADIDRTTTPAEASLVWAIQPVRRRGGAREGGFPGADRVLDDIANGPKRKRVGLRPEGRAPVRAGAALYAAEEGGEPIGAVSSGGFGPSVGAPVAMGYAPSALAQPGARLFADVRGRRLGLSVVALPFVPAGFKRA